MAKEQIVTQVLNGHISNVASRGFEQAELYLVYPTPDASSLATGRVFVVSLSLYIYIYIYICYVSCILALALALALTLALGLALSPSLALALSP
jgi:hypothetical protein